MMNSKKPQVGISNFDVFYWLNYNSCRFTVMILNDQFIKLNRLIPISTIFKPKIFRPQKTI